MRNLPDVIRDADQKGLSLLRRHSHLPVIPMLACDKGRIRAAHHPLWECVLQGTDEGFELLELWLQERRGPEPPKGPVEYFRVGALSAAHMFAMISGCSWDSGCAGSGLAGIKIACL